MIGKEILNYVIIAKIGSGGMGTVYLAEHKFIKKQKVAIKIIKSGIFNDFAKNKLKEEAELLASLDHPNIVKFLNYDIDAQGNVYLIMEYAEGATLDKYINSQTGLIVEEKILPLFEPILDAFEYAHKKKVVHRDIKPANIIITKEGVPKILDFGISTIVDDANSAEEAFIMGTPSYMSPEQVKGKGIDTRADIYSLGVLLHQMLTGNAPYDTTTLSEQDINEKVVTEPLPRMKTYYHYISDKLQSIVDKATIKDPKDRYQTCAEFKRAMRKALVKEHVSKSVIAIAATVVVLLVVGLGYLWDYNRVKVRYYKDYVEQWGIPQGIGKLSSGEQKHLTKMYRFEYQKHKLQRMSLVNSFGSIIDDGELEKKERPVDVYFFYNDDDNLSRAKVMDRNGQVLYVKAYNEKLNTVIFQFDDEYGTEKTIGSETVGDVDAFASNQNRGKISRYLLEYDENGYVKTLRYGGFQNVSVGDANGIYGKQYVRDSKGRVVEEMYLAYDGSPKATKWGLGKKIFAYDEDDNWIISAYLTVDGEPALDVANGTSVCESLYDEYGNMIAQYLKTADGNLMLPSKYGFAGQKFEYDDQGYLRKALYFGIDGNVAFVAQQGYAMLTTECNEYGFFEKIDFFDAEGNPCLTTQGNSSVKIVTDSRGNELERWNYNQDGELVLTPEGYAGIKVEYNDLGHAIKIVYYGINGEPCEINDGYAGYTSEYNQMGDIMKVSYLDTDMKSTNDNNEISSFVYERDLRGNITKMSYYDESGNSTLSNEGIATVKYEYDDNGNEVLRQFFDVSEKPTKGHIGYAQIRHTYDDRGYVLSYRYYNTKGDLVLVDDIAGIDYKVDERGNIIEEMRVGLDGRLAAGKLILRNKYDAFDNNIEITLFDKNNKPVKNSSGYHKATYKYNNRNQCIETSYYGTNGKLTKYNEDKYAIKKDEYDDRGNRIRTQYFGVDEKPVCCDEGWASSTREYNAMGNVIKQSFFGIDGKPTDPSVMVPEGIVEYDKWGNMAYIAAGDGHGNLIYNPQTGCCITRNKYDSRGNILAISYFDKGDKPMINRLYGYHKKTSDYTASGKEKETCYFGVSDNPIACEEGYHKEIYDYNEQEQPIRLSYWNAKGKAVDCSSGFHKVELKYNDSGIAVSRKYYNASNQLLLAERWDGSDWVDAERPNLQKAEKEPEPQRNVNRDRPSTTSVDDNKRSESEALLLATIKNMPLPMDVGNGMIITKVYIEGNYFTYFTECDENIIDIDTMKSSMSLVKDAIIGNLLLSDATAKLFVRICIDANKGICYKCVGKTSRKTCYIYISVDELKDKFE